MSEAVPGYPVSADVIDPDAVNAAFAEMMGLDPGALGTAPTEIGAPDIGRLALKRAAPAPDEPSVLTKQDVTGFARRLDASALSMTPAELEGYYRNVDKVLNPRLEAQDYVPVETDGRQKEMARACYYFDQVEQARRLLEAAATRGREEEKEREMILKLARRAQNGAPSSRTRRRAVHGRPGTPPRSDARRPKNQLGKRPRPTALSPRSQHS